jgi:glycosyltransferase involved in cell wall biosynthesis
MYCWHESGTGMSDPTAHVALYLPSLASGGAERVAVQLAAGLLQAGLKVDLVLVRATGEYLSLVPPGVHVIDLQAKDAYRSAPALLRYLKREQPDGLISALDLTNLVALLVRRTARLRTRVVIQVHSTVSIQKRSALKKKLEKLLLARIYPWADCIVTVSRAAAQDLTGYTGIPLEKMRTIYNPIIGPDLPEKAHEAPGHPWFTRDGPPVILGVGRLAEVKDFPTLLRAFALLRQASHLQPAGRQLPSPVPRLVILGEGEERPRLEQMVDAMGLGADVALPGFAANPFAYMSKADVFVLSSRLEGLPSALIEALACGCPVVSTDCPSGPAEILDGGKYGHLVSVGDAQAISEAIIQVLQGNRRLPPQEWLRQFELAPVVDQYLEALKLKKYNV